MRARAMAFALSLCAFAASGCEKPRERACRSLVVQAKNAEEARVAASLDAPVAVNRARSAARWLRSNAVEDDALKKDAAALADALDRLADARMRLADATDVLGATDAADLVARAANIDAYLATVEEVPKVRRKSCPWYDEHALIEDPRCEEYQRVPRCNFAATTLAEHATRCIATVEGLADVAVTKADAEDLASRLRTHATWLGTLPPRPLKDMVDRARAVSLTIAERGRADADVTTHIRSLEGRCAH